MKNLYEQLNCLAHDENSPFYRVTHVGPHDGAEYHVFSYHIGSYQDFCQDGALECRGTMFRIEENGPVLVSLPFSKFFNYKENPFTMDLNLSAENVDYVTTKEDGSLISTYLTADGRLALKSKTSLTSSMAVEAEALLKTIEPVVGSELALCDACCLLELQGFTVIMEYVSPANRIVLPYDASNLVVLGVRNRDTGELMPFEKMNHYLGPYLVKNHVPDIYDFDEFFSSVPRMKGIEGFVVRLKDGTMFKMKTDEYVALHHAKDSVRSPRRLMEVVLEEASDDIRQMFADDPQALAEIDNMERYVTHLVAHLTKPVDEFWEANQHLERKDFAIKAQQELDRKQFSIAMGRYCGKEIDYKALVKKNHQEFLRDYQTTLVESTEQN